MVFEKNLFHGYCPVPDRLGPLESVALFCFVLVTDMFAVWWQDMFCSVTATRGPQIR